MLVMEWGRRLGDRQRERVWRRVVATLVSMSLLCLAMPQNVAAYPPPAWVEPRALNMADIAGQVPDWVLANNIVSYSGSAGIAQFVSSQATGSTVSITLLLSTRRIWDGAQWLTNFNLLGQRPMYDHMANAAPQSWLRLYSGPSELTAGLRWATVVNSQLVAPSANAAEYIRYPQYSEFSFPYEANGRRVPANMGGELTINGDHAQLTAVYTVQTSGRPQVTYLGMQEAAFQSYIGPGGVGAFQPLMNQLMGHYPWRHPRVMLNIPSGANYVMFTYPPLPFDVYDATGNNLGRPSAGTVRLAPDEAMLSQDLAHGGAFPLNVAWQDAGQSAGPYLSLLPPIDRLTPPEYVVPAGTAYDPCFLSGNCSDGVLESIYNATMTLRVIYLKVEPWYPGCEAVPLRMADTNWSPGMLLGDLLAPPMLARSQWKAYMPIVFNFRASQTRPTGYFERSSGRMVGYLP